MCSVIVAFNISVVVDTTINYRSPRKRFYNHLGCCCCKDFRCCVINLFFFNLKLRCERKMGGFTVDKLQVFQFDLFSFEDGRLLKK
jgi:hypothetical protein